VLVVDDDEDVRTFLCSVVSSLGFRIFPAASGAEAVELLRHHAGEVSIALVDLTMPVLSGTATITALKRLKPELRCCLVSGDEITPETMQAAGVRVALKKPFTMAAVAQTLWEVRA
jgi:CheY-like chemotaxis protein